MITREECRRVLDEVARKHKLLHREILGPRHWPEYVVARREIARQLRERGATLMRIGKTINRHHATVINLLRGKQRANGGDPCVS